LRRFVWPVSECPQESRPVEAPGSIVSMRKQQQNFKLRRLKSDNPQ
jgi:hypothetical protein